MPARIRIHDARNKKWERVADLTPPDVVPNLSQVELNSYVARHERGDDTTLQMFEVRYPPDARIDVHAHLQDEIIYVACGSLLLGRRELGQGSSVFVARDTLYSFSAGKDGLHMINFRPHQDESYIRPEQFEEKRNARRLDG